VSDRAAEGAEGNAPWTIRAVLRWASSDFAARGNDSAGLEAELLVAHALGVDRVRLLVDAERVLDATELAILRGLIQRRRSGEPVAYILGRREFNGLEFRVDPRVLIPRPDTETLVYVALRRTAAHSLHAEVLDLCTGSGCVAIALAKTRATWRIIATDVSPDALEAARSNAQRLGTVHNLAFARSDLFAGVAAAGPFDLITCNPPYIPSAQIAALTPDIRGFEPHLALDGGDDGLTLVRRVIAEARRHLRPQGVLALEVGDGQAPATAQLLAEAGFVEIERQRDYGGHERVVSGRTGL
jgi:release factor glutamine methyltransferase